MKKIMVVDDEPDNIELMKIILTKYGFEPQTFTSPENAMNVLKAGYFPDLLILDMRMPVMSGTDFCEELRKDNRFDDLKIVFFTASSDPDKAILEKYKAKGFIYKPFDIKELVGQINMYLVQGI